MAFKKLFIPLVTDLSKTVYLINMEPYEQLSFAIIKSIKVEKLLYNYFKKININNWDQKIDYIEQLGSSLAKLQISIIWLLK